MSTTQVFIIAVIAFTLGFFTNQYFTNSESSRQVVYVPENASPIPGQPTATPDEKIISIKQDAIAIASSSVNHSSAAEAAAAFSWERVNQLIAQSLYDEAITLLQTQLGYPKNAAQAWQLLAQIYKKKNQPSAAIDAWFRYLKLEVNPQKIERALHDLKSYLLQLNENPTAYSEDHSWLIAQFDALLKYTANDGDLHLVMAALYLKLSDSYQAQYHALMGANDPKVQQRAEAILASLNGEKLAEDISIPLLVSGNKYILNASIEGHPVRFLLDTGASLSGLSNSYTAKYPSLLKDRKPIRLNTASGSQNSFLFTVNSINIGSLEFNQHILAQLPMDDAVGFDGLLGVDILGRFDFVIDQDAAVLRLKARRTQGVE